MKIRTSQFCSNVFFRIVKALRHFAHFRSAKSNCFVTAVARRGVTLVEVIFSIGVIVVGLLGLLSILPAAGKRAQEAVSMNVGASIGDSVMNEILSRHWISNGVLVDTSGVTLVYDTSVTPPTLTPAGPFAIDPLYFAQQAGDYSFYGYTDAVFPYYSSTHNPLLNPSGTPSWPSDQPRMNRVGFAGATIEQARSLIESSNDLVVTRPDDRSENARFNGLQTDSGLEYGRRVPSGEYSWIATVSPLLGNKHASVSVVVLRNRDRTRDYPTTTPDPGPNSEVDPKGNGVSERLAYVSAAYGFRGGAGGTVHLIASENTLSSLTVGKWLMLSRRVPIVPPPPAPQLPYTDVHHWYRVAAVDGKVDGEVEKFVTDGDLTTNDTNLGVRLPTGTSSTVWRRKVLLDGPDWSFNFLEDDGFTPRQYADSTFVDNTFATILTDVVSVTERVIPLADL